MWGLKKREGCRGKRETIDFNHSCGGEQLTTEFQAEKEVETSSENQKNKVFIGRRGGATTSGEQRRTLPHLPQHLRARWSRLKHGRSPPSPLPLIQAVSMISHYPLATLLPWPAAPHHHPDPDCTLLLEGEGGVALQRYQARSPESSPHHWVSTPATPPSWFYIV